MQINSDIEKKFGKWLKYWKTFIESEEMDKLFRYIKQRVQSGAKILPPSDKVFRCFADTDPDKLKCIIVGIAPYHTTYGKEKEKMSIADGLALSCSTTWKQKGLQPSLDQIYGSWEKDYNETIDVDMVMDGDLSYLASQGVLLYNIALTVEENKPLSMNPQWEKFNEYFWKEIINKMFRGVPCVFMGNQSHKSIPLLTPMLHYPISVSHPASASYNNTTWSSEGCWKKVDKILMDNNGDSIQWYKKKGETKKEEVDSCVLPSWVLNKMDGTLHDEYSQLPWEVDTTKQQ